MYVRTYSTNANNSSFLNRMILTIKCSIVRTVRNYINTLRITLSQVRTYVISLKIVMEIMNCKAAEKEKTNSKELVSHYKKLLQNGNNSDVIIRFDQGELYAHSLILRSRSSFFDRSNVWAKKEGNFFIIEKKALSINTFKAVLSYIYTTEISLNELNGVEILEFIVEIDKLLLLNEGIKDKLFFFVHEKLEEIIRNYAIRTLQIVFQYNTLETLREPCLKLICTYPKIIFEHSKFIQLDSYILARILQRDDLGKLSEINILNYLIKWGIAQVPASIQEKKMNDWERNDYIIFKNAINEFIPLIRWFQISNKDFRQNKQLFQNILSEDLFDSVLSYHLDPKNSQPTDSRLLIPRDALSEPKIIKKATKYESFFSSHDDLVNNYKRLFQINDQYDVIIRVNESIGFKDFYAHSLILRTRSSYFETICSNNEDKNPFIFTIENISTTVVEVILRYLYTTEFDFEKLDGANILMLIIEANKMDVGGIINNLLPTNFTEANLTAIDDISISDDFIQSILDKLNFEQFLQFMKTVTELQDKIIVKKLFSNANFNFIVNKFHGSEILRIMIEAHELKLQNLFSDISTFIEQNLENLLRDDAVDVLQTVFNHDICKPFHEYCIYLICLNPNALFDNRKLIQLDHSILFLILQRDDMGKLSEKKICDYLIRWGAAQNDVTIRKSIMNWTTQEFNIFEKAIHEFIPLIRWFSIPAKDFNQSRSFLENVLPDDLYQNIVDYHLDPSSPPKEMKILPQRYSPCTFLLKPRHFKIFESWIEEVDQKNQKNKTFFHKLFNSNKLAKNEKKEHSKTMTLNMKPYHFSDNNLYDFVLLYHGSENDFNAKKFHESCDNKGPTLTIIKTDQNPFNRGL
ncbi:BTB-domain-containing protein [Gigaspora margarita]|uniref:BTB-domain-containing protein n=1 Tax=Gigaspora margarita TaxID=4874 RepID=A0A8H4ET09_GIGMA|nr:BTB-domain-containing protein [Gigaspora margarita]